MQLHTAGRTLHRNLGRILHRAARRFFCGGLFNELCYYSRLAGSRLLWVRPLPPVKVL